MESWRCVSGGEGLAANDTFSPSDSFSRSKNSLMGWELNVPCSLGYNLLVSHQEAIENPCFGEFGIQDFVGKQLPHNKFAEDESTSKLSTSAVDSNSSRDSSLIDLNLGRFVDKKDAPGSKLSHGAQILCFSESSTLPKRVRLAGISSQTALCVVYGCNKDLSSSKDYHKRHKVCEVHSKAAKVTVNGVVQRFCQQCSRFHLLDEFDDGKRSCRKRLASHNERRRKPQVGIQSGRNSKLPQSHEGWTFQGTTMAMSSFSCQDIIPMGLCHPERSGPSDWCKRIKVEERTNYNPLPATSITKGNVHSKSFFPHDFRKVVPSFLGNEANTATENIFSITSARYPHDLGRPNSGSSPLFHDISLGTEDFNSFDTASTIQGLSGISDSGSAPSLLSSKSQNCSSPLSGIPVARPPVITGSSTHYNSSQVTEKLIGVTNQVSNRFSSSGDISVEGSNLGSILLCESSDAANIDVNNGFYRGSHFMNSKDRLSCEDGATIDLLNLSPLLQQVEHQRQSMQVEDENDSFCCLRIT